jgi:hypothetical protein
MVHGKHRSIILGLIGYLNSERTLKRNFSSNLLELAPHPPTQFPLSFAGRLFLNFCVKWRDMKDSIVCIYYKKCHSQPFLDTIERQV